MIKDSKNQLGVYSVVSDESGRDVLVEIGCATPHRDGEGFDLTLRALPLASRLVLREAASDDPAAELREDSLADSHEEPTGQRSLAGQVREFERAVIRQCLLETGGNIAAALERLKIPRRTLNEKMVRLGIDRRGRCIGRGLWPKRKMQDRRARSCRVSRACSWSSCGGARTEPAMASSLRARMTRNDPKGCETGIAAPGASH